MAESEAPRPCAPLRQRIATRIAVVGGGFTGVSAAWHLRRRNPDRGVVLLEAGVLGGGASGRNGGQVLNWVNGVTPKSPEEARRIHAATRAGIDLAETLAERYAPPGTFRRQGCLEVYTDARRAEADVFDRLARKREYFELLAGLELAPVDSHRVLLRRHEPQKSRASFRVELTKVVANGCYVRVVIELVQEASVWAHKLVEVDGSGEVAHGTEALRGTVYRLANFDAETLFVRLHELDGVHVERVQRGIVGPVLWAIPEAGELHRVLQPVSDPLADAWHAWLSGTAIQAPQLVVSFASDTAAADIPVEASNDPLSPLLATQVTDSERARYSILRERHPFRVYKDRKFVVTDEARPLVDALARQASTKNLVYPLR